MRYLFTSEGLLGGESGHRQHKGANKQISRVRLLSSRLSVAVGVSVVLVVATADVGCHSIVVRVVVGFVVAVLVWGGVGVRVVVTVSGVGVVLIVGIVILVGATVGAVLVVSVINNGVVLVVGICSIFLAVGTVILGVILVVRVVSIVLVVVATVSVVSIVLVVVATVSVVSLRSVLTVGV